MDKKTSSAAAATRRFNEKKSAKLKAGGQEAEAIRKEKREAQAKYRALKKEREGITTRTIETTDEEFVAVKALLKSMRKK